MVVPPAEGNDDRVRFVVVPLAGSNEGIATRVLLQVERIYAFVRGRLRANPPAVPLGVETAVGGQRGSQWCWAWRRDSAPKWSITTNVLMLPAAWCGQHHVITKV